MKIQLHAALLPIFLLATGAAPAAAQTLPEQLQKCFRVYGVMDRLACYDEVARGVAGNAATSRPMPPAPAMPANPATAAAAPAPAPRLDQTQPGFGYNGNAPSRQTTQEAFGGENIQRPAPAGPVDSITAAVTDYKFTPQGRFIVTLANRQVWQQIEGDVAHPLLNHNHTRSVTISRGLLGSYNLSFSDQTGRFKVERTR
jgi:hypothetical protein